MFKKVKVIGLQRSGTNYLNELIRLNFDVRIYDDPMKPFFKHALPIESVINIASVKKPSPAYIQVTKVPSEVVRKDLDTLFLVVEKNLHKWINSIINNRADLEIKRPELFYDDGDLKKGEAIILHRNFHGSWRSVDSDNLIFVQYRDLVKDFGYELSNLPLKRKTKNWLDISHVPHSKPFTKKRREHYLS